VFLLGTVAYNDLAKYYAASDMYVAPSIRDSHGNLESHIVSLFEAFASGLPIVATTLAVSAKYIKNGVNGYRVTGKSSPALAKAIIAIMQSPNRLEMGNQNRNIAKNDLSYKTIGKAYSNIFMKVIGDPMKNS
jgi:glycosyltransferase involved in cell wall biosynthesis